MRKLITLSFVVALTLFGTIFLKAQQKKSFSFKSVTTLFFRSCLFEAESARGLSQQKDDRLDILLMAKIYESGLSKYASKQLEELKNYFRLPNLRLKQESQEIELTWEIRSDKEKRVKFEQKVRQTAFLNGVEYNIFLIPQEINTKEKIFRFILEVYKIQKKEESSSLASIELVIKKDILWNFNGPLAVGFFFGEKIYFLTFTIRVAISSYGYPLGSSLTWII